MLSPQLPCPSGYYLPFPEARWNTGTKAVVAGLAETIRSSPFIDTKLLSLKASWYPSEVRAPPGARSGRRSNRPWAVGAAPGARRSTTCWGEGAFRRPSLPSSWPRSQATWTLQLLPRSVEYRCILLQSAALLACKKRCNVTETRGLTRVQTRQGPEPRFPD